LSEFRENSEWDM